MRVVLIFDQCLDVQDNSGPIKQPHYFTQAVLQTYQCYPESRPQTFHILA